jgi:hypothetical protein
VLRDPGVLADRQPEPPAVELDHGRRLTGAEAVGLRAAEPHLPVDDPRDRAVDREHRDVRAVARAGHGRADERDRARVGARRDDRLEPGVVDRDCGSAELVPGERELGEDHDAGSCRANRVRMLQRIPGHVERHAAWLDDGDGEGLSHGRVWAGSLQCARRAAEPAGSKAAVTSRAVD